MDRAQLAEAVRSAWGEVLQVDVDSAEDFYEAGGDSLNAAEVTTRVADKFPEVADLDITVLTALLEEAEFNSVIDAVCSELSIGDG